MAAQRASHPDAEAFDAIKPMTSRFPEHGAETRTSSQERGAARFLRTFPSALCVIACALFATTTLWFFFGSAFGALFNSDAAVPALLAQEILRKGTLLPDSWYFVNAEIWTFGPQIFVLPFIATLGLSMLALKVGNLLAVVTMFGLLALPVRRITKSWAFALTVAAGVLACHSALQAFMIYGQTAYGWFLAQFALLLYLALRMQGDAVEQPERLPRRLWWIAALYALVLLNLSIESPLRAAAYWIVPLAITCAAFPVSRRRATALIALSALALVAGAALHVVFVRGLLVSTNVAAAVLSSPARWLSNLSVIGQGVPMMTEHATDWLPLTGLAGLSGALRIVFLGVAVVAALAAFPLGKRIANTECRFFMRLAGVMFVVEVAILAVSGLAVGPGAIRYLLPPMVFCITALMSALHGAWGAQAFRTGAVTFLFVLLFCGGGALFVSRWPLRVASSDCDGPLDICNLQRTLLRNGLDKGYATYWHANVATLTSRGRVVVCSANFVPGPSPRRILTSKDCFDAPSGSRYFVVLDRAEVSQVDHRRLSQDLGSPDQVIGEGVYQIMIYSTAKSDMSWLQR